MLGMQWTKVPVVTNGYNYGLSEEMRVHLDLTIIYINFTKFAAKLDLHIILLLVPGGVFGIMLAF